MTDIYSILIFKYRRSIKRIVDSSTHRVRKSALWYTFMPDLSLN